MIFEYLTLEEILWIHFQIIQDFGGSHGVHQENRLKSVVEAPQQEAFGTQQYATLYEKAAVYLRNIIGDHPFSDGNKRTGVTVCAIFLTRNNSAITATPEELEEFVVRATTEHLGIAEISDWLSSHTNK